VFIQKSSIEPGSVQADAKDPCCNPTIHELTLIQAPQVVYKRSASHTIVAGPETGVSPTT
jgi:hypothetical protein